MNRLTQSQNLQFVPLDRALPGPGTESGLAVGSQALAANVEPELDALRTAYRDLEARHREMQRIAAITESINAGLLLDDILDNIYRTFHGLIPFNRLGFAVANDEGTALEQYWARSDLPVILLGKGFRLPLAHSSLARLLGEGQPRIINDLQGYLRRNPRSESTRLIVQEGLRSSLTCPLVADRRTVGVIFFTSTEVGAYRDAHVETYMRIAQQLAVILEKGRLTSELAAKSQTIALQNTELQQLNQLKNTFLGMAAHDLRNPISSVRNFLRLFLQGRLGSLDEQQKSIMLNMEGCCASMIGMINDLLDIAAIESGRLSVNLQPVSLAALLQQFQQTYGCLGAEKNVTLEICVGDGLPEVMLDAARMTQVLGNLVSNAVKHSFPGRTVSLRCGLAAAALRLEIEDHGQGIPEADIPRLFQEFTCGSLRATAGEKSTGLGLAIVRKLVVAQGGEIDLRSQVGHGTTVTLTFPLAPP